MKVILHVLNYGAAYRGNFIESLEMLNEKLEENDMKNIYLFCASARSNNARKWIDEMVEKGDEVFFLSDNSAESVSTIKAIIASHDVVIVHTHFISMEQFREVNKAVPKRIPVVMHMHNHSRKCGKIKALLRQVIYRRCIMVACSESVYHSLERDYPRLEKYYVDNGVNFDRLDNWAEISPQEYGIEDGEKIFLIFGFDFYRKGVDLALKAVDAIRKKGEKCTLLISLSTNFEYVENETKKILGELPDWVKIIKARNDVASLYNMCDLFLSPSREEGLPYSVIEAEYCKCSVVLSDISAQSKLRLKHGYWFKDGDVCELEEKILKALEERDKKLLDMGNVREHMRKEYSLSEWCSKILELYEKIERR